MEERGYVIVTDFIPAGTGDDVSDAVQAVIDANPNRTIYFPDGVYVLAKPICTPADPAKSVDLRLSNFAVLKAAESWDSDEAMVRLGGKDPFNTIYVNGSNYAMVGGIVDGSGIASGISIDSGRETAVREVSLKHVKIGLHIKHGANSGSSDCDIMNVNIVGTGGVDSVGVFVEGYDNTFTNMRIANVFTGFLLRSGGNCLRNIHPLYTSDYTDYQNSTAFRDEGWDNWYNFCYSDQYAVGFRTVGDGRSIFDSCFCFWYSSRGEKHTAFRAEKAFGSMVQNLKIGFRADTENAVLSVAEPGGNGVIQNLFVDPAKVSDPAYRDYLAGKIL